MITPAIRRDWSEADRKATILDEVRNNVSFQRGLGDSGRRVETTINSPTCPHCDHDRMIRTVHVHPEAPDSVEYWCLDPVCPYFVSDELSHHTANSPRAPAVWTQSTVCPECGEHDSVEMERDSEAHRALQQQDGNTLSKLCVDC